MKQVPQNFSHQGVVRVQRKEAGACSQGSDWRDSKYEAEEHHQGTVYQAVNGSDYVDVLWDGQSYPEYVKRESVEVISRSN